MASGSFLSVRAGVDAVVGAGFRVWLSAVGCRAPVRVVIAWAMAALLLLTAATFLYAAAIAARGAKDDAR